jgi:predicted metal-dependent phosphotriesterase family hydrolase
MARPLRARIGKHVPMTGHFDQVTMEQFIEARRLSDEAVSLSKYLIQHLANRHDANLFARAVGMPGYINLR